MSINILEVTAKPEVKPKLFNLEIPADKKEYELLNQDSKTAKFGQILLQVTYLIHVRDPSQT